MRAIIFIFSIIWTLLLSSGCQNFTEATTTIEIVDNDRHYYPILRGQELDIVFTIKNTGNQPFILKDMLITCGCISPGRSSINQIPAGKEGKLILKYDSAKNLGYVKHHIDLYGNFKEREMATVTFDVNVVPESDYTRDYEEIVKERKEKNMNLEGMVDREENNKGYYMDEDF